MSRPGSRGATTPRRPGRSAPPTPPAVAAKAIAWPALFSLLPLGSDSDLTLGLLAVAVAVVVSMTLAYRRTISRLHASEASLTRRMRLEEAILGASTRFINADLAQVDQEIDRALCELGEFAGADRCYVFQFEQDATRMSNTHEWCRAGVSAEIEHLQALPTARFPWVVAKVLAREVVLVPRVRDLPPEAGWEREEFERENIESLLLVPMTLGEKVVGFVGLDSVTAEDAWTEETVTVLRVAANAISGALARRLGEQALRAGEQRYRSLVESTSDWIWEVDAHGVYTYVSPKVRDLLGYEPEEVLGRTCYDLMPPEEAERVAAEVSPYFARGEPFSHLENIGLHKDGHEVVLDTSGVPVFDQTGRLRGFRGIDRDITEQRRAQQVQRESEARYRQFLQISAEGIWRLEIHPPIPTDFDPEEQAELTLQRAVVAECNEVFAHRNGAARSEELVGARLDDLWLAPREVKLAVLAQAVRSGYRIVDLESTAPLPDGSQGYFLDNFVGVVEGGVLIGAWGTERDITARRRAEEALRRERELVDRLLETSPIGITAVNREGRITFANAGAKRVLGMTREEIAGLAYNDPRWRITDYAGQPIPDEEMPFRKVRASGQAIYDVRHAIEHPDGRRVLLSINAAPIFTEAGEFDGMVAAIEDVTEMLQAEEALRESEQRFRAIVESTRDWIWFCGVDGVHRYSNRAVQDLLGYAPEEIFGQPIAQFMHPDDLPNAMAQMQHAIAARSGWASLVIRWRHKDGTYRHLESAATPAFDAAGELTGWYGIDRDITERIQLQESLGRSEARLRALFAAMTDIILVMDSEGRYLEIVPTKPDLLYRPAEELLGKTVREIFAPEQADFFLDHIQRALSLREPVSMAYTLPIGDRNLRFAAEVSPLSQNSVLIVARDITAQTEQYEQWLAAERARASLAEHLNAEINHRARNNLAMVSGLLQMQALQEPDPALAARLREAVARIRTFVDIHEKIYATGTEQVDLLEVLRQVADTLRTVFSNIGAVFSVEGESLPCHTRAATNLAVVTNELITNALKYGGPGRDGRLHVVVQLLREQGQLKVAVQNTGPPVDADFDLSAQPGMGLRLASDMAAQHGGSFSLRPVRGGNLATLEVEEATLQE